VEKGLRPEASPCARHIFEETKRCRLCQETNNNELSQGNSNAHGNDNEYSPDQ
jgi:hypothetical protein